MNSLDIEGNSLLFKYEQESFSITDTSKDVKNIVIPYLGSKQYKEIEYTIGDTTYYLNIEGDFNNFNASSHSEAKYTVDSTTYDDAKNLSADLEVTYVGVGKN